METPQFSELTLYTATVALTPQVALNYDNMIQELWRMRHHGERIQGPVEQRLTDVRYIASLEQDVNEWVQQGYNADAALCKVLKTQRLKYVRQDTLEIVRGWDSSGEDSTSSGHGSGLSQAASSTFAVAAPSRADRTDVFKTGSSSSRHQIIHDPPSGAERMPAVIRDTPLYGSKVYSPALQLQPRNNSNSIHTGVTNAQDHTGFTTINAPISRTREPSNGVQQPHSKRSANASNGNCTIQKDRNNRLGPVDRAPSGFKGASPGHRFAWNLGFWLSTLEEQRSPLSPVSTSRGEPSNSNLSLLEYYANLFFPSSAGIGIDREEAARVQAGGLPYELYRTRRARIVISCALIYEHNLRGSKLNTDGTDHAACRPPGTNFRYSNIGKSQAQMVCIGVDVNKTSAVYDLCKDHGHVPTPEEWGTIASSKPYLPNSRAEKCFPSASRQALYQKMIEWYISTGVPEDLQFCIIRPR